MPNPFPRHNSETIAPLAATPNSTADIRGHAENSGALVSRMTPLTTDGTTASTSDHRPIFNTGLRPQNRNTTTTFKQISETIGSVKPSAMRLRYNPATPQANTVAADSTSNIRSGHERFTIAPSAMCTLRAIHDRHDVGERCCLEKVDSPAKEVAGGIDRQQNQNVDNQPTAAHASDSFIA